MVSISLCMIVKNEARVLNRCLDSVHDLVDEIIIVDTGSTDETKTIAKAYSDNVYDFEWTGSFADARNYAFSLCTCDYIYSADADEVLYEEDRNKFRILKETLDPSIEIVQMYYTNQLKNGTVYNFDEELRAKLFKRVRSFTWIEPIHECVRELPLVFDSDIRISHEPLENHSMRDFSKFEAMVDKGEILSSRLFNFYARELFVSGELKNFDRAEDYFTTIADSDETNADDLMSAICIVTKAAYWRQDYLKMYRYALKAVASNPCSEVCFILGSYYEDMRDYKEAALWYYNAAFECNAVLNIRYEKEYPLQGLVDVYNALGLTDIAKQYEDML